ncbi:LuxR C-terminal-related transcriptional regulator [Lacicoccus alkaliphilus]|nr:LuxR C-terminal-related transcriptional regulator [Salinicoccus alkaliphilus]
MISSIELIEKVQKTFATQYGLTFFLTDSKGEVITSAEDDLILCKRLLGKEEELLCEIRSILMHNESLSKALTYEIQSGLFIMASPVPTDESPSYYLWAGVLVEGDKDSKQLLDESDPDRERPTPILAEANKDEWLGLIEKVAQIASLCLRHEEVTPVTEIFTDEWRSHIQTTKDPVIELFSQVIAAGGDIEFLGLAEQTGEDIYTITKIKGEEEGALQGARFLAGEGFLGRTALTGERLYWEEISGDRRSRLFSSLDKQPMFLFTDLLEIHDDTHSVLFGGSFTKGRVTDSTKNTAQTIATLVESSLTIKGLRRENSQQLSRLTSLIDIGSLMASTPDPRRTILILLDISINLVEGAFSSIVIKDRENDTGRLITRGNYKGDINEYVKSIMERTAHLSRFPAGETNEPQIEVMPNGREVIECPLSYGREMMGILSVAVPGAGNTGMEENLAFLQTLSIIGSVSLQLAERSDNGIQEQKAEALHLAVSEFDGEAYRRSKESAELAAVITGRLESSSEIAKSVVLACQLSYYSPSFVHKMFPDSEAASIMETGNAILNPEDSSDTAVGGWGTAGYIYALCLVYAIKQSTEDAARLEKMDSEVFEIFSSLVRTTHVTESEFDLSDVSESGEAKAVSGAVKKMKNLSPREREVLILISEGKTNQEIAELLYISTHTVKNHVTKIFHKLGVSDRANAISKVYRTIHSH